MDVKLLYCFVKKWLSKYWYFLEQNFQINIVNRDKDTVSFILIIHTLK